MAMCYLVFVVPAMLADAGMPKDSAVAATIWVSILATLAMGLWAKFPVGVAPGLGITAFFAYYICGRRDTHGRLAWGQCSFPAWFFCCSRPPACAR